MASDATFDNQLQALATATANFANDKDTQIKNTIITALGGSTQQGGGSGGGLPSPNLTATWVSDGGTVSFSGNGQLHAYLKADGDMTGYGISLHDDGSFNVYDEEGMGRRKTVVFVLDSDGTYAKDWFVLT